jgi:2-polyprenyl-3-methyl-5-hydroxy-6-metoxy-1,4-benzoquinol methylase
MKDSRNIWNDIWQNVDIDADEDSLTIQRELSSISWQKIESIVAKTFKSFSGIEVIELGSGRGEHALLMALQGAQVTLCDYSDAALEKAEMLFSRFNCEAKYVKADIFYLPSSLKERFDISMSFGLAEHFKYPQRQQIFQAHYFPLKEKGLSFISVPNAFCLSYRLSQIMLMALHKFPFLEIPFTRSELRKNIQAAGYESQQIIGSSFIAAFDYFILQNAANFINKRICRRPCGKPPNKKITKEKSTFFDDYLGYALVAVGYKNETNGL